MQHVTALEFVVTFLVAMLGSTMPGICQTGTPASKPPAQNCALGKDNSPNRTLSGTLSQSNEGLCLPNVDPGMTTPAPNKGTVPLVPPPGSGTNPPVL